MKLNVKRIKVLLAENDMTQTDLANKIGSADQHVSSILTKETCSLNTLGKISKALGVSPAEIIKEE